ncbi:hypothetical protein JCM8115_006907 [Rhodotorula mucilaginosa]
MDSAAAHKLIPTFLRQLKAELAFAPAPTATLLPLLVATTLGRGRTWLRPCLDSAFEDLPPSPNPVPAEPHGNPLADAQQHPRRLLVAQIKESLAKASILIGIPRAIVMLRALGHIVPEGDQSKAFVRRQLELDDRRLSDFKAASSVGLNEVYRGDLADILDGMKESGYDDARLLSECLTYGAFLTPCAPRDGEQPPVPSPDPLDHDSRLLSVVSLSTLLTQRSEVESFWHLRGALRRGWTRQEVEALQSTIEQVAAVCGEPDIGRNMPRINDVPHLEFEGEGNHRQPSGATGVSAPVDDPAHCIFAGGAPPTPTSVDSLLDRELDSTFVELCGGRIVREVLLRHNVEKIFGYPGGAVLPVFDIVFGCPAFDFIIPRHEQGAGHMAQGYARVSGKPGVVLVTSGPGATNMITPMQDALADGIPLVVLCGQVPTAAFGTDAFQEADIVSLSQACTKWNYMVDDIEELPRRLKQAFEIATSGRPGPVLVGIPKDIGNSILRRALPRNHTTPEFRMPRTLDGPASLAVPIATPATTIANDEKLQAAAAMISAAERPVIYAGHGILTSPDGPELLRRLAHEANIPVTTTMHGLGAFDELDDKHALHMLGMHGSAYANLAMQKADVIIALSARFDDRITGHVGGFAPAARSASAAGRGGIIHFEIEPKNINKTVAADIAVQGDVADSMRKLLSFLPEESDERAGWFAKIQQWKGDYPFVYHPTPTDGPASLKPQEVIESLDKWCEEYGKENVVITTGVGQHQMWACQHYRWRHPRTLISSGGLGTMGYGLPAAIGAKRAAPEKVVVDIDGDASFVMSGLELMTASQYDVGVKVIVFNNRHQGMVIQWQDFFYKARHPYGVMSNPDFVTLANSMGVHAIRCDNAADLPAKMKEFMEYDNSRPVLLDACIIETETVCPQVLPGKALHDMVMHKSLKDLGFAPSPSATLLPLLTAATLGKGCEWLQPCVEVGFELLPPNSASSAPRPALLAGDEPHSPRRFLVAQVKEAITKSAILIGVPRSIELAVKLGDFLDEEDLGKPFVRQTLEEEGASVADLGQNGLAGLRTVYKENLDDIFANFSKLGLEDILT